MRIVWLIRFLEAVIIIVLDTFTPGSIAQLAVTKDQLDHLRSECGLIPVATMAEGLDIQPASVTREPRTLSEDCAPSDKLLLSVLPHPRRRRRGRRGGRGHAPPAPPPAGLPPLSAYASAPAATGAGAAASAAASSTTTTVAAALTLQEDEEEEEVPLALEELKLH